MTNSKSLIFTFLLLSLLPKITDAANANLRFLEAIKDDWLFSGFPSIHVLNTPQQFNNQLYPFESESTGKNIGIEEKENGKHLIFRGNDQGDMDKVNLSSEPSIHMVMFYANWCPVCHRYAPTWVEISREYEEDNGRIIFNAFDCAGNLANLKMCKKDYDVKSYPTLFAFVPKQKGEPKAKYFMSPNNSTYITQLPDEQREFNDALKWIRDVLNIDGNYFSNKNIFVFDEHNRLRTHSVVDKLLTKIQNKIFYGVIKKMEKNDRWDIRKKARNNKYGNINIYKNNNAYLHDAIVGFLYILRNWVGNLSGLEEKHILAILKLLSAAKNIFPGRTFSECIKNLITFFYNKLEKIGKYDENKVIKTAEEENKIKTDENGVENEIEEIYITFQEWHTFLDNFSLGVFKSPGIGETPIMKVCKTVFCPPWIFFHFMSVGLYKEYVHSNDVPENYYNETLSTSSSSVIHHDNDAYNTDDNNNILNNNNRNVLNKKKNDDNNEDENENNVENQMGNEFYLSSQRTNTILKASEFLEIIKTVINLFFDCTSCRSHFLQIYDACAYDRCNIFSYDEEKQSEKEKNISERMKIFFMSKNDDNTTAPCKVTEDNLPPPPGSLFLDTSNFIVPSEYELLIFWLWRVHNTVSVRTATEDTALAYKMTQTAVQRINADLSKFDEIMKVLEEMNLEKYIYVDVRWPSAKSCPNCRDKCKTPLVIREDMVKKALNNELEVESELWDLYSDFKWHEVKHHIFSCYWNDKWKYAYDVLYDNDKQAFYIKN